MKRQAYFHKIGNVAVDGGRTVTDLRWKYVLSTDSGAGHTATGQVGLPLKEPAV